MQNLNKFDFKMLIIFKRNIAYPILASLLICSLIMLAISYNYLKSQIFTQSRVIGTSDINDIKWNLNKIQFSVLKKENDNYEIFIENNIPNFKNYFIEIQTENRISDWFEYTKNTYNIKIDSEYTRFTIFGLSELYAETKKFNILFKKKSDVVEIYGDDRRIVYPSYTFKHQSPNNPLMKKFRSRMDDLNFTHDSELSKIIAIRRWVRNQQGDFSKENWKDTHKIDNPLKALEEMQSRTPGLCRRFAIVSLGAYISMGLPARLVFSAPDFSSKSYNHSIIEVWSQTYDKWIVVDATMDTFYLLDGVPAGLLEFSLAVQNKEFDRISFERNGSTHKPVPGIYISGTNELTPFIKSFQHTFYSTSNALFDGYGVRFFGKKRIEFVHYVINEESIFPQFKKTIALSILGLAIMSTLTAITLLITLPTKKIIATL